MDWKTERDRVLESAGRVVVKVGSAVLTGESGLDLEVINHLAGQIAWLHDKGPDIVMVSSGAVAAGRRVVGRALMGLPARQAASAVGQSRLMHAYDEAFERLGKVTAQVLITRAVLKDNSRFLNALNTFRTLFSWRVIPVVNENDTVSVQELEFGDNDYLASLVLNLVQADLFVNLTSARGVFDQNPDANPKARRLKCIEDISAIRLGEVCGGKTLDGTGGMYSKLLAARRAAQLGVPTLIVSGRDPECLSKAFSGQDVGTWIMPEGKKISRRKFRLAYNFEPAGSVIVDAGAADALTSRGKSLLPAGIQDVEGDFDAGALVKIKDSEGNAVGVGLSNYNAGDLRTIMGKQSAEIKTALGRCPYPDAVHRDNMLLDAAV